MSGEHDAVNAFVDRLLANKRHRRCRASRQDLEVLQVAIWLRAARPGSDLPDAAFLERLGRRVRSELGEAEPARSRFTRRAVLRTAAVAAGAVAAGGAADRLEQRMVAPLPSQSLVPDGGAWRPVATLDALATCRAIRFSTDDIHGVLLIDNGQVRALSGVCTHLGCILTVDAEARRLDCPCHEVAFSWDGSVLYYRLESRPPALAWIPTRVREGIVEVLLS